MHNKWTYFKIVIITILLHLKYFTNTLIAWNFEHKFLENHEILREFIYNVWVYILHIVILIVNKSRVKE